MNKMHRNQLDILNSVYNFCSESLILNVFTSSSCTFCDEALNAAFEVAEKFSSFDMPIEVVETSVEDSPEVIEAMNAIALPMIQVGNSRIIGLPSAEDIELLVHQLILAD
ncbi:MAG: hypothetical protein ACFFEE_05050 [Candidatus Thorarchaeota archaeon]